MNPIKIKRALISVSDKTHLDALVPHLMDWNVEVIASGGTRKHLESLGCVVTLIESVTNNPEAFDGRMKTLSFQVASSLLFRRDSEKDISEARRLSIEPIDMLICNLYPFEQHLKNNSSHSELIEQIDIGGPTLIRAAAKNYLGVTVLTSPKQYELFIDAFHKTGEVEESFRHEQAKIAFRYTAKYEAIIASYFSDIDVVSTQYQHATELRYGENPHQKAFLMYNTENLPDILNPIHGKPLSYNNVLDLEAAVTCCSNTAQASKLPTIVVVKHNNPCGAASHSSISKGIQLAWAGDPVSSFGSIIAASEKIDVTTASFLENKFIEIIAAPDYSKEALEILKQKQNLRIIRFGNQLATLETKTNFRSVFNCCLTQDTDSISNAEHKTVTNKGFDPKMNRLIDFGVAITAALKSNAIALVAEVDGCLQLLGAGMGNPNRLVSIQQAIDKAFENGAKDLSNTILISDAFFPFTDNIEIAQQAGIKYIVQPGGSIKDQDVINACNLHNMAMLFTQQRHFLH